MELSVEEVGPTNDTINALLEFLVDPLLPSKCLSKEGPPSKEHLVAKQVHAVVLLYNYYHRKHNPGLEFLEFIPFCKLTTALRPNLLPYLPFIQKSGDNLEADDLDKHLSLTEKAVMNACDVCRSLDASDDKPATERWPISKVAVFIMDSRKQNCFLFHSSVTQGVWSVIEKQVALPGGEVANKKNRVIKKTPKENLTVDEVNLQQAAFLAVKEACALNQGELKILETHTVYSTSKAKTAVRLYIMRCRKSNQDQSLVPITDVLGSLQGPLVTNESGNWLITPVVEYFHLIPLADKLSEWLSRSSEVDESDAQDDEAAEDEHFGNSNLEVEESPNASHKYEEVKDLHNYYNTPSNEKLVVRTAIGVSKEARNSDKHQSKEEVVPNSSQYRELSQAKENVLPSASPLVESAKDARNGNISNSSKDIFPSVSNHSEIPNFVRSGQKDAQTETMVYKKRNRTQKNSSDNNQGNKKTKATHENLRKCSANGLSSGVVVHDHFNSCLNGMHSNSSSTDRADDQKQIVVAQEPDELALNGGAILTAEDLDTDSHKGNADEHYIDQYRKQDCTMVSCDSNLEHLRKIQLSIASREDFISQTLKALLKKRELLAEQHRVMGDEIALCDRNIDIVLKGGDHPKNPDLPPLMKRKRLSEAKLSSQDPCRELDCICNDNIWSSPTYNISTLGGGFKAVVSVKGVDFDCSSEGTVFSTPQDARNSAALQILTKLRNMQQKLIS